MLEEKLFPLNAFCSRPKPDFTWTSWGLPKKEMMKAFGIYDWLQQFLVILSALQLLCLRFPDLNITQWQCLSYSCSVEQREPQTPINIPTDNVLSCVSLKIHYRDHLQIFMILRFSAQVWTTLATIHVHSSRPMLIWWLSNPYLINGSAKMKCKRPARVQCKHLHKLKRTTSPQSTYTFRRKPMYVAIM